MTKGIRSRMPFVTTGHTMSRCGTGHTIDADWAYHWQTRRLGILVLCMVAGIVLYTWAFESLRRVINMGVDTESASCATPSAASSQAKRSDMYQPANSGPHAANHSENAAM